MSKDRSARKGLARLRAPGVQIVSLLGILAGLLAPAGCGGGKPQLPPPGHVQVPWIEVESAGGPWNVLLLTLDTVRADRFGCYGSRAGLTPRLDEAARRGVLFENAVAPTPITLPSHATMLTGLDPQAHGVRNNGTFVLDPKHVTLAELLKGEGYATGAVIGAVPLEGHYGLDQGFDSYDDKLPAAASDHDQQQRRASEITDLTLSWIKAHVDRAPAQPFFHFSHYYDAHYPYAPPEPYRSNFEHPYDGEIAYVDAEIGRLFDELEKMDLLRRTWIVIVADHGEALGEHGETYHSMLIYRATQHVPFLILPPADWKGAGGSLAGRRVRQVARLQDIAPTLANGLGLGQDKSLGTGTSLLGLVAGQNPGPAIAYMETLVPFLEYGWCELRGVTVDGWTYIKAPEPELYNLRSDPQESRNLYTKEKKLAGELAAWCEWFLGAETELRPQQPDQETIERLRSLGYVGNAAPSGSPVNDKDPKKLMAVYQAVLLARSALDAGDPASARATLEGALRQDPDNPEVTRLLGSALVRLGQPVEAAKAYESLRRRYPNTVQHVLDLAYCRLMAGQVPEGVTLLEEVLRMSPSERMALQLYPRALAGAGREEEARRFLRDRIAGSAEPARATVELAQFEWERNRHRESAQAAEAALKLDPEVAGAHSVLGLWWWEQATRRATPQGGNIDQGAMSRARQHLEAALRQNPADPQAGSRLAALLQSEGKGPEASELLVRVARGNPSNPMSQVEAARALHVGGRTAEAIPFYEAALRTGYAEPQFLASFGLACAAMGNRARAAELLRRALAMNPEPGLAQTIRQNLAALGS